MNATVQKHADVNIPVVDQIREHETGATRHQQPVAPGSRRGSGHSSSSSSKRGWWFGDPDRRLWPVGHARVWVVLEPVIGDVDPAANPHGLVSKGLGPWIAVDGRESDKTSECKHQPNQLAISFSLQ